MLTANVIDRVKARLSLRTFLTVLNIQFILVCRAVFLVAEKVLHVFIDDALGFLNVGRLLYNVTVSRKSESLRN